MYTDGHHITPVKLSWFFIVGKCFLSISVLRQYGLVRERMSAFLIGVDIGTMGTKAVVIDADDELKLHYPRPGWVEQYLEDFYKSAIRTIHQAMKKSRISSRDVAAIAFSAIYPFLGFHR